MVPDIIASHESNHSIFDLSPLEQWREDLKQDDTIQKQLCTFVNWGVFGTMKGGFDIFNCNRKPLAISFVSYMSLLFVLMHALVVCFVHMNFTFESERWVNCIQVSFIRRHLNNKCQSKQIIRIISHQVPFEQMINRGRCLFYEFRRNGFQVQRDATMLRGCWSEMRSRPYTS